METKTPKQIAKKQFELFKNNIDQADVSNDYPHANAKENLDTINMINFMPEGEKARSYYEKLCKDYLERIGFYNNN
ncbi:hypothetical protein [Aquimarina sediminis]|uniref:hypothetical protein n=1 Tax=Aquimarina sediminis TaxID=2070536 RepID=UPI000CA05EA2|nr:hypothetical protein [Aquimarina sediminis]